MAQITAGIGVYYRKKSTEDWIKLSGITSIPEIGGAPETFETTSLDNTEYKTYVNGLKDTGGALQLQANDTPEFRTAVKDLITAQEDGGVEFAIDIPEPVGEYMTFDGEAAPLCFGGAEINGVLTTSLYVTPKSEPKWNTGNVAI